MIALDTNVLARALAADDPAQSPVAQKLLGSLTEDAPGFVSLTVTVELFWFLRKKLKLPADVVITIFDGLLATPVLELEDGESVSEAVEQARRGADFGDALVDATSRIYWVDETVTFDRDAARRFGWRLLA